ncbi:hypothetical protein [Corynebacterium pygosceleis]|uniref:DUF4190 domain-containing protein n=1 Tax=Corynebacterium pygosceleis TaxID=2800406 RepID=A0A9Q4GIT9_9CORY|nr:hypothetical protein [Corynebacterium pygosceleis]MCK7637935.1 hypothetical protein [Corynebacterium pygosceleis]MCK7675650.1 hypothetical protein [Corynebacterium pygosceleis]MCL0120956.1 hypothetical protein [Corynebacterium pygosceleis]MCX7444525.1 hypothetical protein [Corynebacterium pygosceleis]MCX7468651.1 hypothetical protein [Corynebacterium pygosceleis]
MTTPNNPGNNVPSGDGYPQQGAAYGGYPAASSAPAKNAIAPWALGVSIFAIVLCWVPLLNWLLALAGIVLGVIGIVKAGKIVSAKNGKGMSIAAVVISVVAIVASIVLGMLVFKAAEEFVGEENLQRIQECNALPTAEERDECIEKIGNEIFEEENATTSTN